MKERITTTRSTNKNKKHKISNKNKSSTKETWENIIKKNEKMIAESWKSPNPQKAFSDKIKKLYKTYKKQ